jgi:hypothetical protein
LKTVLFKAFYIIKPLVPRNIQLFLRTIFIKKSAEKYKSVWPILESAARKKPADWKGWPDNKEFAIILTHDVEHQRGYDRTLDLMQLEKDLGFVSSFNFVPERDYRVEKTVLNILTANGFEVGVQGLHHDGKLYSSRKEFLRRAVRINEYLKDWDAVGFRSPAMHHNLEWLLDLDIKYDLSTFDTDPFEPQSDGMGTIFPFRVNGKANRGYLELPYTLPQDSTLFIIMQEKNISIWLNKLEWIIRNKGMALVNVHPDYINFTTRKNKHEEYPVSYYLDLLKYIKNNYEGCYWNVTPKELTGYLAEQKAYIQF